MCKCALQQKRGITCKHLVSYYDSCTIHELYMHCNYLLGVCFYDTLLIVNVLILVKKRQVQSGTRVAFFASLTTTSTHLGADQDIAFDNAVSNIGHAYHPNHGTLIAPVAGVYVFTATLVRNGHKSWGHFMKNRQVLAKFNMPEDYDSASQTIIVELNKDDEVAVQNTYLDRAFAGDRYSTFAGFLLYEHMDDTEIVGK